MMRFRHFLHDTSGASIVIALVFFLICGIVGSVVVTAASVQAKSVQTHEDMQQDEYSMQSAAELVAQQLGGTADEKNAAGEPVKKPLVSMTATYSGTSVSANLSQVSTDMGKAFWTQARADALFRADYSAPENITITPPAGAAGLDVVHGTISIDRDRNLTVRLSLSPTLEADSNYNMTVSIQCTPTYDADGKLIAIHYGDNTVIEKDA